MTFTEWYNRIEFSITFDRCPWLDKEYILEMLEMDEGWKNNDDSQKINDFRIMLLDELDEAVNHICKLEEL